MAQDRKIFVGGVPQDLSQDDLYAIFSEYAEVRKAWLQKCRANEIGNTPMPQNHRGFGFVIFRDACTIEDILGGGDSRFVVLNGSGARLEIKRALSSNKMGMAGPNGASGGHSSSGSSGSCDRAHHCGPDFPHANRFVSIRGAPPAHTSAGAYHLHTQPYWPPHMTGVPSEYAGRQQQQQQQQQYPSCHETTGAAQQWATAEGLQDSIGVHTFPRRDHLLFARQGPPPGYLAEAISRETNSAHLAGLGSHASFSIGHASDKLTGGARKWLDEKEKEQEDEDEDEKILASLPLPSPYHLTTSSQLLHGQPPLCAPDVPAPHKLLSTRPASMQPVLTQSYKSNAWWLPVDVGDPPISVFADFVDGDFEGFAHIPGGLLDEDGNSDDDMPNFPTGPSISQRVAEEIFSSVALSRQQELLETAVW